MRFLLAACAALLICAPAYAHVPGLKQFWPLAVQTFPPLCENPRVVQVFEVDPEVEHDGTRTLARAWPAECRIEFPAKGLHDWPAWLVCSVLVHEAGHLGEWQFSHSDDPHSVMYPLVSRYGPCVDLIRERRMRRRSR
jgi:hypothetical protein